MTQHKNIFTKFMIEYDKANVTSSYPSLTEYEIATVLDKAYLALIAQKVTGNNVRRAPLEADIKSISDISPLITTKRLFVGNTGSMSKLKNRFSKSVEQQFESNQYDKDSFLFTAEMRSMPDNMRSVTFPGDLLYFVAAAVPQDMHITSGWMNEDTYDANHIIKPMDNKKSDYQQTPPEYKSIRMQTMKLVSHQDAEKFFATASNIPWVKNPVCFFEGDLLYFVVDPIVGIPTIGYADENNNLTYGEWISLSYIKSPHKFAKDLDAIREVLNSESRADNPYNQTEDIKFVFDIDRYNYDKQGVRLNDGQIHLNNIRSEFFNPVNGEFTRGENIYYIEDSTSRCNPNTIYAAQMINRTLIIDGKLVKYSNEDDLLTIKPNGKLIAMYYNSDNQVCSKLYELTYDELFRIILRSNLGDAFDGSSDTLKTINVTVKDSPKNNPIAYTNYIADPVYNWVDVASDLEIDLLLHQENITYDRVEYSCLLSGASGFVQGVTIQNNQKIVITGDLNDPYTSIDDYNPYVILCDSTTKEALTAGYMFGETPVEWTNTDTNNRSVAVAVVNPVIKDGDEPHEIKSDLEHDVYKVLYDIRHWEIVEPGGLRLKKITDVNYISYLSADGKSKDAINATLSYSTYDEKISDSEAKSIMIGDTSLYDLYLFELNDVIVEELISLAITYALENVESPRLNAHLGIRGLEG